MTPIELFNDTTSSYIIRCNNRLATMGKGTMDLFSHYMSQGDTLAVAQSKVQSISQKINATQGEPKFNFVLGDTALLKTAIEGIIDLDFFDSTAKTLLLTSLNLV